MSAPVQTIIPTIQTISIEEVQQNIDALADLQTQGVIVPTHFQIDIVDGLYADYLSVMPDELGELDWHGFTFETHLLTVDPEDYIGSSINANATAIIAQIERLHDRTDFLKVVKELHHPVGLALDIYTPIEELTQNDLELADIILLMAVPAGFSGQEFKPLVIEKIKELRGRGFDKTIEIDGGINPDNAVSLLEAGATKLAVNSFLWHDGTVKQNLQSLIERLPHAQSS